jgi:hypothetical protein
MFGVLRSDGQIQACLDRGHAVRSVRAVDGRLFEVRGDRWVEVPWCPLELRYLYMARDEIVRRALTGLYGERAMWAARAYDELLRDDDIQDERWQELVQLAMNGLADALLDEGVDPRYADTVLRRSEYVIVRGYDERLTVEWRGKTRHATFDTVMKVAEEMAGPDVLVTWR